MDLVVGQMFDISGANHEKHTNLVDMATLMVDRSWSLESADSIQQDNTFFETTTLSKVFVTYYETNFTINYLLYLTSNVPTAYLWSQEHHPISK